MKKTFPLRVPGQEDQRVVESIKNDVRKYVKRERRKTLPAGVDFWDFACKAGVDQAAPEPRHVAELTAVIETAAQNGALEIYVEILAIPGHRTKKPVPAGPDATAPAAGQPATGEAS